MSVRVFFPRRINENQEERLREAGFSPVCIELIRTVPVEFDAGKVVEFSPDFVIVSSRNGVKHFLPKLPEAFLKRVNFIAVGSSTASSMKSYGISPLVPDTFSGEGIVGLLNGMELEGRRFLIVRPKVSRDVVRNFLLERGAVVEEAVVYETVFNASARGELLSEIERGFEFLVFTSPSTFRAFLELSGDPGREVLKSSRIVPIGNVTSKAIEERGFCIWKLPEEFTVDGVIAAILEGKAE